MVTLAAFATAGSPAPVSFAARLENVAAFAKAMCDEVGAPVPTVATPIDAETLYTAADAVDIAVLSALGSR